MLQSFDIVVAADLNSGIGKGGRLPWKLSGDMKYFRELTATVTLPHYKNAVIMGRKTWESIPDKFRPLPDRVNVVLTRAADYALPEGVLKANSFDDALEQIKPFPIERCFVIGGGEIYREALRHPACKLLYLTEVQSVFDCDTFLPGYQHQFEEISSSVVFHDGDLGYCFKVLGKSDDALSI